MADKMADTANQQRRTFLASAAALLTSQACAASTATPRSPTSSSDVIVLGAGLAGLNAAWHLQQAGLSVKVLEASQRIGGRVYTLDNVPGRADAGANQIGAAYKRVAETVNRLGLKLVTSGRSPLLADDAKRYVINGKLMTREAWATSVDNPFAESLRTLSPERILARLIGNSPLSAIEAWCEEVNFVHDVSVIDKLRQLGLRDNALRLLEVNNAYGDTLAETSLLNLFYVQTNIAEIMKSRGPIQNVAGGNQRLPEAMAAALHDKVELGKVVTRVVTQVAARVVTQVSANTDSTNSVEVICADKSVHRARYLVCALPLPAMRNIHWDANLPPALKAAIDEVAYARVTQLHMAIKRPFWKDDGIIPYIWSDGSLERVFPIDPDADGNAVSLTVWINGAETAQWDKLSDREAEAYALTELKRILPASEGALSLSKRVAWHQSPLAGGAWANWRPGQITKFSRVVGEPVGRIHFAGEHTARAVRGMEGAMESGERVALEIQRDCLAVG